MNEFDSNERQIHAEIERLRSQFPNTQDLYREVCVLLFFRFGITPTANKLYQLVRKGSMSAPAEALSLFWENLREKSRVRIEHPDLPESLKTTAGQMVATLWSQAQTQARDSLAAFQADAEAKVTEAKVALEVATERSDTLARELQDARDALESAKTTSQNIENRLTAEIARSHELEAQVKTEIESQEVLQQSLENARRDFVAELDKQRAAIALAEERLQSTERRSLLEIDKERMAAKRLEKELESARTSAAQVLESTKAEVAALQSQLGDLRQQVGSLEGNLQATKAQSHASGVQLQELRAVGLVQAGELASARSELDLWKKRAIEAEGKLSVPKPPRVGKPSRARTP